MKCQRCGSENPGIVFHLEWWETPDSPGPEKEAEKDICFSCLQEEGVQTEALMKAIDKESWKLSLMEGGLNDSAIHYIDNVLSFKVRRENRTE